MADGTGVLDLDSLRLFPASAGFEPEDLRDDVALEGLHVERARDHRIGASHRGVELGAVVLAQRFAGHAHHQTDRLGLDAGRGHGLHQLALFVRRRLGFVGH